MAEPMFADFIAEAVAIKESGRWGAINERVDALAKKPGEGNEWYVQLFGQLCAQVFSEYIALKCAVEEQGDDTALIAWRAQPR